MKSEYLTVIEAVPAMDLCTAEIPRRTISLPHYYYGRESSQDILRHRRHAALEAYFNSSESCGELGLHKIIHLRYCAAVDMPAETLTKAFL